ncbi:uncharacterized protein MKK02DRAFT_43222 [Dioszegia hungarica]|uniref:Uncharacterized protein n=1 Tax=Dioszegia hungarica TaxID=4972 RepID=A0AA38HAF4_9TREE|nr:uncharacterized protein MKK02DRAFT_43222 [Dioszegia hungarica]KAI9637298.1 hypothetical protein MKK02DRAFT_43222 [Dioszegia hungarica]
MSPDPSTGGNARRIVMNPPDSFLQSAAAQAAIEAGKQAPVQANGPIAFAQGGQAVMMPNGNSNGGSSSGGGGADKGGSGGGDVGVLGSASPAMGMGVNTPDQKGLDPAVMQSIQQQLASGAIAPSPEKTGAAASAITPNSKASPTAPAPSASPTAATATAAASASANPSGIASVDPSASALPSPILATDPSASISPSASADAASSGTPFIRSPAFILLMVFSALILLGMIATALSWFFRWKGKGSSRSRRDVEADDLSDIVRNFESRRGSYGTGASAGSYGDDMEKRSSLLAEEMGRGAPFLHSGTAMAGDGMEDVDLGDEGLPRMPAATMPSEDAMLMMGMGGMGSPRLPDQFGTGRLEVRNRAQSDFGDEVVGYGDKFRTMPAQKSWSNERGLSNLGAGWMRNKSTTSLPSSTGELPSPFHDAASSDSHSESSGSTAVSRHGSLKNKWDRSASTESAMTLGEAELGSTGAGAPQSSTWATNLRTSLLAAISGPRAIPDDDKFTRPVLPQYLSRSSTHRSGLSRNSTTSREGVSSNTFGRAGGAGLVITEEDDEDRCSLAPSARRDIEAALLGAEGVSRSSSSASSMIGARKGSVAPLDIKKSGGSGERWKRYARSSKGSEKGRDEESLV